MQTEVVSRQLHCSLAVLEAGIRIRGRGLELVVLGPFVSREIDLDDTLRFLGKGHEIAIGLAAFLLHSMTNEEGAHEKVKGAHLMSGAPMTPSAPSGHLASIVVAHAVLQQPKHGSQVFLKPNERKLVLQIHTARREYEDGKRRY